MFCDSNNVYWCFRTLSVLLLDSVMTHISFILSANSWPLVVKGHGIKTAGHGFHLSHLHHTLLLCFLNLSIIRSIFRGGRTITTLFNLRLIKQSVVLLKALWLNICFRFLHHLCKLLFFRMVGRDSPITRFFISRSTGLRFVSYVYYVGFTQGNENWIFRKLQSLVFFDSFDHGWVLTRLYLTFVPIVSSHAFTFSFVYLSPLMSKSLYLLAFFSLINLYCLTYILRLE